MRDPISLAVLSDIIGAIYDCAIDPALWPATMDMICRELDFRTGAIGLIALPDGEQLLSATTGFEAPWLDRASFFGPELVAQWGGPEVLASLPVEEPAVLSRVNPAAIAPDTSDRFHIEFNRPQGFVDSISVGLVRDARSIGFIGFNRHESVGLVGEREVETLRLLIPHLRRAAAISRLLDIKTIAAATFQSVLDTLATPVVLVDARLQKIHANRAAEDMLARGDLLQLKNNLVTPRTKGAAAALAVAVRQAADDESALGRKGFGIPIRGLRDEPRALHVLPLQHGRLRPGIAPAAVAAIFVSPLQTPASPPAEIIAALFDLTAAERRVLEKIVSGHTVTETAEALDIGVSTVKTHLVRLFDKMNVHRQADLVALAASFALPVRS
ncbi:helix-turn-helix transcriptional regulator [Sphingomonas cannabina]|uniref:helix-turn-helix transcriptional regulator n=1 Tax=Sphingomonas cannabina TaxID=2899123 RepID=UPI001F1864F2|nr:helix-turn-helix transcriptional regulator [Sphingomonas cannabina]UIJ44491.1 helix-turn-helix transcriptional regulator [Sphingomonas cannabina]